MKKVLVVGLALVLTLICCGEVLAAPTIDFEGSEIRISGEYLPDALNVWGWGISGILRANLRGNWIVWYTSLEAELVAFTEMGETVLDWGPFLQDYYWKFSIGCELDKLNIDLFLKQYCLHSIDGFSLCDLNLMVGQYTGIGFSVAVKL